MTYKEEKIAELEELMNGNGCLCSKCSTSRKEDYIAFISQTIDSLEAKHQEEIKQLYKDIEGIIKIKDMERVAQIEGIKEKITPELITSLFENFYKGDWYADSGDTIDLIRVADYLKNKLDSIKI